MPSHIPKYGNLFEFDEDEIIYNRIKTYPKVEFFVYTGSVFYNNSNQLFENSHTPQGHINLYDLNVYRNLHASETDDQLIYPFITKGGSFTSFKTVSASSYGDFSLGDTISMTYPLTSSISVDRYSTAKSNAKLNTLHALRNTLNHYVRDSQHYAYSSSYGEKETQPLNVISIPSIFYGSSINKGSVKLKYYVSGTLIAEASDTRKNGEILQTSGNIAAHIGNQIGVVLYNEGFIILTSSYALDAHQEIYEPKDEDGSLPSAKDSSWHYFATTDSAVTAASSSFKIEFEGVNYIDTITMFAHAKEGQLNFSNNPTFLQKNSNKDGTDVISGSNSYIEDPVNNLKIKNIVSSSHSAYSSSFEPITYISKVGIYDKNKNLIAVAGLANPVKKRLNSNYTFKLKLDI